jgi:LacI family transcriptional regulator
MLRDVARRAGVSTATASRALSRDRTGQPPVSEAAARVVASAAALGYLPNHTATALRTKRSRMLGVVVPDLSDAAVSAMYDGVEERAARAGYQTCVANSHDDPSLRVERAEAMLARGVDGLVFADAHDGDTYYGRLHERGVPLVLINRPLPGVDSVACDDVTGGRLVADHLLERGHVRLTVVAGPPHAPNMRARAESFADTVVAAGGEVRVAHCDRTAEPARRAVRELLSAGPPPTAVFAVTDLMAIGAMTGLREEGHVLGSDVALVGYNDSVVALHQLVPLTSVRHPLADMGAQGAEVLLERIDARDHPARQLLLAPTLVVRESSQVRVGVAAVWGPRSARRVTAR